LQHSHHIAVDQFLAGEAGCCQGTQLYTVAAFLAGCIVGLPRLWGNKG
jgi:hypothetical protein